MSPLEIIYEDNHILAVNKPAGLLVQGDRSGDDCVLDLMKEYLRIRDAKPGNVFLGLPHRLDRPTSGVVALAKTSKALSRMAAVFRERETEKIYWAVVVSRPRQDEGELTDWLIKDGKNNVSRRVKLETPGAKEARLRYRLLGASERYWLLEVELITGRHHQIRVQLSGIGCSIKGDLKYGARRSNRDGGIHLHARSLAMRHPVRGELLKLVADPPSDPVWNALRAVVETGESRK